MAILSSNIARIVVSIITLLFIWFFMTQNVIIIILVAVLLVINLYNMSAPADPMEHFDACNNEFLPPGVPKYDLRGFPLLATPIYDCRKDCFGRCYNSNL